MKIEYKDADGRVMELDVSDEIGQFYLSSVEEAEKSDRRNTRPDRHTSLETFVYEDQRFFASASNPMKQRVFNRDIRLVLTERYPVAVPVYLGEPEADNVSAAPAILGCKEKDQVVAFANGGGTLYRR